MTSGCHWCSTLANACRHLSTFDGGQVTTPPLFHYTCAHSAGAIGTRGVLRPRRHPLLPGLGPVVWATDLEVPDADALGLTMANITCDRTAVRYRVDAYAGVEVVPYLATVDTLNLDPQGQGVRWLLELPAAGRQPERWWVVRGKARGRRG